MATRKDRLRDANYKHWGTRLYDLWVNMRQRCSNPNADKRGRYCGRGIQVCDEWHDFDNFRSWAMANGYEDNLSIDRIDNDGDYNPNNCRFVDAKAQARNRIQNVWITIHGKTKCLLDWSRISGISVATIKGRLQAGWDEPDAVFMLPGKMRSNSRMLTHDGQTKSMSQWAHELGIRPGTISERLRHGWSVSHALSEPVKRHSRNTNP